MSLRDSAKKLLHRAAKFYTRTIFIQTLLAKGLTLQEAKQLWRAYDGKEN